MDDKKKNSKLDIVKRVSAITLAVLLVILYVATLVFAIMDDARTMSYFKASVALTIIVPVLIYAYKLVFRVVRLMGDKDDKS